MATADILAIAGLAITIIGSYTWLIYKIGQLTAQLNQNTALILEVREIVVNDKRKIEELEERILIIETQHSMNHGGK